MKDHKKCTRCNELFLCEPIFVGDEDIMQHVTICDVCTAYREAEREKSKGDQIKKSTWEDTVPLELRLTDINHKDYYKVMPIHNELQRWIKHRSIDDKKNRPNFGIIGTHGSCKSRVIARAVRQLIIDGERVVWSDSTKFQWCIRKQYTTEYKSEALRHLKAVRHAPWLVMDDIGALKSSEAISDGLYSLLKYRTENRLRMLWTSNEKVEEMLVGIENNERMRSLSRLAGYSNIITI